MSINPEYAKRIYQENVNDAIKVKEAFFNFVNMLHRLPVVTTFDIGEAVITMEQKVDDLLGKVLNDAEYEAGIVAELPKSRYLRNWENSRILTNPQTYKDKGEAI